MKSCASQVLSSSSGVHGLPRRSGKLPDLAHFDSAFFSVSPRQAHSMDPQLRILLELTYEAIVDSGESWVKFYSIPVYRSMYWPVV